MQNLTEMTAAIDANEKKEEKKKKLNDKLLNNLQKMSALSKIGKVKKVMIKRFQKKLAYPQYRQYKHTFQNIIVLHLRQD